MKKSKVSTISSIVIVLLIGAILLAIFLLPPEDDTHEHTWETDWSYDSVSHWKNASCGHNEKNEEAEHLFSHENKCICGYQRHTLDGGPDAWTGYINYSTLNKTITIARGEAKAQVWYGDDVAYEKTDSSELIRVFCDGYVNAYERALADGIWTKETDESGMFRDSAAYILSKYPVLEDINLLAENHINEFAFDKESLSLRLENYDTDQHKDLTNVIFFNEDLEIIRVEFEFILNGEGYSITIEFDEFEVEIPVVDSSNLSVTILPDGTYILDNVGDCDDKDLVIPSKIGDIEITAIAPGAFANSDIHSVTIPGSVKTIGTGAFKDCPNLSYVYIDSGVEKIEKEAFAMIDPHAEIHLHDSVTVIEEDAFDVSVVTYKRGKWYFYGDVNKYVQIDFGNSESTPNLNRDLYINGELPIDIVIDTATSISSFAFASLESPKNYYIGKQVTSIGEAATGGFYCEIDPETGAMSFEPYNVYYEGSFEDFLKIDIKGTWVAGSGCNLYFEGELVETVEFPAGTDVIPEGIFAFCVSIKNVIIPEGVTKIEQYALCGLPIVNLTLPTSLSEIEYDALDTNGLFISPDDNAITEIDGSYYMAANGNPYYVLLYAPEGTEIHPDCVIVMNPQVLD